MDKGIIGVFTHNTSTSYIDVGGRTQASVAATSSYQTCTATPNVGGAGKALITVNAAFAGGMTTWTIMARIVRLLDTSKTWVATEIMLERLDGSVAAAIENPMVAADFVGVDGAACDVAFVTTSAALSGTLQLRVKGNQAAANGDAFWVALDVGA